MSTESTSHVGRSNATRAEIAWMLVCALSLLSSACERTSVESSKIDLLVEEIVTNPTSRSVQINLLPAEDVEIFVSYSAGDATAPIGELIEKAPADRYRAGRLAVLTLDDLEPGTRYRAWLHLRRPGAKSFQVRPHVEFRTLYDDLESTVRFAYAADSHIAGRYILAKCRPTSRFRTYLDNFQRSLENILARDLDFVVAGGDNFMTHAPLLETCEGWQRYGSGTVRRLEEADLRYELALSNDLWGRVGRALPFLYVLGNHDGEARFGDDSGSYGHFTDTRALSRDARLRHLSDPTAVYRGSDNGDLYFTFTSGAARFIILDVMAGPKTLPRSSSDWTLGEAQKRWLRSVLEENRSPWIFVFAEHLVGGITSPDGHPFVQPGGPPGEYHYGRGGLRATEDRTIGGRFLGEQALLQEWMRAHGVDVFFHGHDHVAIAGQKFDANGVGEGVYYVMGGQVAGDRRGSLWIDEPWFIEQIDYDGDGEADLDAELYGTRSPGFYAVTVHGSTRVDVEFVRGEEGESNGQIAFQFSIFPDGRSDPVLHQPHSP